MDSTNIAPKTEDGLGTASAKTPVKSVLVGEVRVKCSRNQVQRRSISGYNL